MEPVGRPDRFLQFLAGMQGRDGRLADDDLLLDAALAVPALTDQKL